jgi:hypothetical protein
MSFNGREIPWWVVVAVAIYLLIILTVAYFYLLR